MYTIWSDSPRFRFRRTCPMCRKDLTCSADDVEVTAVEELSPGFADRECARARGDYVWEFAVSFLRHLQNIARGP